MATDVSYTPTTWANGVAPGISASELQRIETGVDDLATQFSAHNGGTATTDHPEATNSVRGFMSAADKTKLDAGAGGGLDADLLDGVQGGNYARSNATDIVTTLRFADGTLAAPSMAYARATNYGWYKSGTTIRGVIAGAIALQFDATRTLVEELAWLDSSDQFIKNDSGAGRLYLGTEDANKVFQGTNGWYPALDDIYDLGLASFRWDDIWATNSTINTSDPRTKKSLAALDDARSLQLVKRFEPVEFVFKAGKRTHYGFDAEQIAAALDDLGVDFAGYVDPEFRPISMDEMVAKDPKKKVRGGGPLVEPKMRPKGLRYGEFLPVLWSATQQLLARVEALEAAA